MTDEDKARLVRLASRLLHKGMKRGGPMGPPKGKKGYTRKVKHRLTTA